jgi:hypothetical protein
MLYVPFAIAGNLGNPVVGVVSVGQLAPESGPVPAVPEVAIAKHDDARLPEYQIRLPRQLEDVLPVT